MASDTGHMAVGMNLENVVDWSPAWTFTDAFKASRPWISHAFNTQTWATSWDPAAAPVLELDADGDVRSLKSWTQGGVPMRQFAGTLMFRGLGGGYAGGTYRAEWDGTGVVTFGMDAVVTTSGRTAAGRNYADLRVTPTDDGIYLRIEETSPTDPVRDFNVWMPDWNGRSFVGERWQPGAAFSPFHPLFLERLAPFDTLRFMGMQETNTSDIVTWSQRRDAADIRQGSGPEDTPSEPIVNGISLEYMVQLANDLDADPWFNMPHMADDTFVRNFAIYVRDNLEAGRTAYVEWSNEIWNFAYGFEATQWVAAQTRLPENAGFTHWQIAGREAKRDMDIWSDVFTGQTNRIIRVAAGQAGNDWVTARIADAMQGSFDAVAIAPYFSPSDSQRAGYTTATTVDQVLADSRSAIDRSIQSVAAHQRLADTWAGRLGRDVRLLAYEGGHHLDGRNAPYQNVFYAASHDPRMGELYRDYLRRLDAAGLDLYVDFTFTGRGGPSQWGDFAKLNRMDQPLATSYLYNAVVAAADGSLWAGTPPEPVQPAIVTVSVPDGAAAEAGADPGVIRVTRSGGNLAAPLALAYALAGTATAGVDYAALPGTVTIPAGQTSVDVTIRPVDDTAVEPVESVVLTVQPGSGYTVGTASRGEVAITSDDQPPAPALPTLSITNATVTEGHTGSREVKLTVTLSARQSTPVRVRWSTADGTARAGSDYTARSGELVFGAGQTSRTIGVLVTGDRAVEADETFAVRLADPRGATLATASATGTIVNDDQPPTTPSLTQNITYAVVGGRSLLMDAYRPVGNGPFPAVVLVHGGGFTGGSKGGYTGNLARSLAAAGYAVFDINYRLLGDLGPGATLDQAMTAAQQDLGRAVDHVVADAARYGIDPNRVAVGGGSAGAITALLASYGPDRLRVQPRAVINLWGGMYGRETSLRAGDPPMLIVHGTADRTVPYSHAEALMAAARRVNVGTTLVRVENGGHTLPLDLVVNGRSIRDSVREFLDRTLR